MARPPSRPHRVTDGRVVECERVRRDHGRGSGQLQSVSTNYLKDDDDDDEKEEEKETGAKCDYRNVEHEMIETSERRTSDGCDSFPRSGVDWRVACISEREEGVSGVCTYYMRDGRTDTIYKAR